LLRLSLDISQLIGMAGDRKEKNRRRGNESPLHASLPKKMRAPPQRDFAWMPHDERT
jgi:hypothetical protein